DRVDIFFGSSWSNVKLTFTGTEDDQEEIDTGESHALFNFVSLLEDIDDGGDAIDEKTKKRGFNITVRADLYLTEDKSITWWKALALITIL
ncbi:hypothetical protein PENTCL1PPCAC_3170, partial [Pristionchus entomophagus]